MSERTPPPGTARIALAIGAVAYVAGVIAASAHPGPRAWALHLSGFLPSIPRTAVLALLSAGTILLVLAALRLQPSSPRGAGRHPAPSAARTRRRNATLERLVPLLLLPLAALLWLLRARTQLLGDGTVWLEGLQSGIVTAKSEPLAAALWLGFTSALHALRIHVTAGTLAILPIACGLVAAVFAAGIARELVSRAHGATTALILLLTLGITQLYCGYFESYPPVSAFVLGYLWIGLRHARGAGPTFLAPLFFALCVAGHLATAVLAPSYAFLALAGPGPRTRKFALALAGPVLAVVLLFALGSRPGDWLRSLETAARGAETASLSTSVVTPAYGVFSAAHLADFANALLLVLPIPLLLLIARAVERRGRFAPLAPAAAFLTFAAVPGAALAALLRLPLAPAQDWDLTAVLLLPAAVLAIYAGRSIYAVPGAKRLKAGLGLLSAGGLLSFLLVNASEAAAVRRLETILAPGAAITSFGRTYGHYMLWRHYSDRGDPEAALRHSVAALENEPENPRYWTNVGLDLYRLKRYDDALPYLEGGVRRGPERWTGRYNLGLCYNAKGRYAEAADELGLAVQYGGDRPDVRHSLGIALYRSGRADSAVAIWRDIMVRWPDYVSVPEGGDRRP